MTVIIDKQQDEIIKIMRFEDIEVGEFFRYHNSVYLKTSCLTSNDTNAFNIVKSESSIFDKYDLVQTICSPIIIQPW